MREDRYRYNKIQILDRTEELPNDYAGYGENLFKNGYEITQRQSAHSKEIEKR